jgi:hypothetical protein
MAQRDVSEPLECELHHSQPAPPQPCRDLFRTDRIPPRASKAKAQHASSRERSRTRARWTRDLAAESVMP